MLVKPATYMNLSGDVVRSILDFYQLDTSSLYVVHDDLDVDFGVLKIKCGGGAGGHKGIQSIIGQSGDDGFVRLKIGIGKPTSLMATESFVLSSFDSQELDEVRAVIQKAVCAIEMICGQGVQRAMTEFNQRGD